MFNKTIKAKDDDVAHAVNAALRILTRREHSILELYKKLILKFTDKASKEAIKKCIENNWQSQERYMQMLFEHLVNQCYGPRKIALEASKKGVKAQ
ncbi:MAG: regulatory protein RecX, partial [Succinatimonas sp.]|nr:regulatory protein RecX [Succinatimonas sp.]